MGLGTGATAAIVGGIGAAGSVAGGVIQGSAAKSAANTEVSAANQIGANAEAAANTATGDVNTATQEANAGLTSSQAGLTAAQNQQLANLAPYTTAGAAALTPLTSDIASETNPANAFSFTPQQYQQNPEYAFQMQQDLLANQQQQAAQGGALTGGAIKANQTLANNLTSTNYGNAFNQALQSYTTNRQNLLNQISGYQGIVGGGLSATNSANSAIGSTASQINQSNAQIAANQIAAGQYAGNTGLTAAQIQAQAIGAAANANAAGTVGVANAATGAINGVTNPLSTYALYQGLSGGLGNPYATTPTSMGAGVGNIPDANPPGTVLTGNTGGN